MKLKQFSLPVDSIEEHATGWIANIPGCGCCSDFEPLTNELIDEIIASCEEIVGYLKAHRKEMLNGT